MKSVAQCVICDSGELKSRCGSVAPFVAHRIWGRDSFLVELLQCTRCGFAFFSPRLDEDEEQRLYADYRSDDYQRTRYSFEPWYTRSFHEGLFSNATMRSRREVLRGILAPYLSQQPVRAILDFGGGRGELISDLVPDAARYVYDLSDAEPLAGIEKLRSLADCKAHRYDLIICSNVLEHVAYPRQVVQQITEIASSGSLVFVEVPHEPPVGFRQETMRLVQALALLLRRPRVALQVIGRGMLYVMHEHVNFYSPASLQRLMSSTTLKIQASGCYGEGSWQDARMLWNLVRQEHTSVGL